MLGEEVTAAKAMLKLQGARTQSCLTPTSIGKGSETKPPATTRADMTAWNPFRMAVNLGGQPLFERVINRRSDVIESFGQVKESYEKILFFFPALLLKEDGRQKSRRWCRSFFTSWIATQAG